jgi:hypothetical protein
MSPVLYRPCLSSAFPFEVRISKRQHFCGYSWSPYNVMNAEQSITVVMCCILLEVTQWLTELQGEVLVKPGSCYDVAVHTNGAARSQYCVFL